MQNACKIYNVRCGYFLTRGGIPDKGSRSTRRVLPCCTDHRLGRKDFLPHTTRRDKLSPLEFEPIYNKKLLGESREFAIMNPENKKNN